MRLALKLIQLRVRLVVVVDAPNMMLLTPYTTIISLIIQ